MDEDDKLLAEVMRLLLNGSPESFPLYASLRPYGSAGEVTIDGTVEVSPEQYQALLRARRED